MLVVMLCYTMSSVALVIFMLVIMPCLVGDYFIVDVVDSYFASRDYVDIMLMHCNCIMLFYHGSAYCIQVKLD